jgi:SAM-dependent methyltransferase
MIQARLYKPFAPGPQGGWVAPLPRFQAISDTAAFPWKSPLVLQEDGVPLGPPHESLVSIGGKGCGRYMHWHADLFFSTSDNSDPNTNGRTYTVSAPAASAVLGSLHALRTAVLPGPMLPVRQPLVRPLAVVIAGWLYRLGAPRRPAVSEEDRDLFARVTQWNAKYFSPSITKCLDAIILLRLLRKYAPPGSSLLFQAVNNARFENDVLSRLDWSAYEIDANDLGVHVEFSLEQLRSRDWVREVHLGSFDDVDRIGRQYDLVICNSGYDVSPDLAHTLACQRKVLKPGGKLLFNLGLPPCVRGITFWNRLYSLLCLCPSEYRRFARMEKDRDWQEVRSIARAIRIATDAGYEILECLPYLHGWYLNVCNWFLWPVYMKYFAELSVQPLSSRWQQVVDDFERWFVEYGSRYAAGQIDGRCRADRAARFYLVLKCADRG